MPTLRFYGASDDLLEVEGDFTEEYPIQTGYRGDNPDATLVRVLSSNRLVHVEVHAEYGPNGWIIGLGGANEEDIWPDWNFRYLNPATHGSGYSPVLEMTVPEGFIVEGDNGCE